ncbi:MAG: T9SS type A sorting domain-containing protein [Bacteroidales bacterium]|nr:T9SS type A sorting domain-containing protein [Bacteroidales bacterium]
MNYSVIKIESLSGSGFNITGNYIGGSAPECGGMWVKTRATQTNNMFTGIYISAGTGTRPSVIENNMIRNIDWSNSATALWRGIHVFKGNVDVDGNYVGSPTGNNSIIVTYGGNNPTVCGIEINSKEPVNCRNNFIGSMTAAVDNSVTNSVNFCVKIYGISVSSPKGSSTTITGNTIGSTSTTNSIHATPVSAKSTQTVIGINSTGVGNLTIEKNTIANLTNSSTSTVNTTIGRTTGIFSQSAGSNIIADNIIHDLTSSADNLSAVSLSVCAIALGGSPSMQRVVSGNTIYNLKNTCPSFRGYVAGIMFLGNNAGDTISNNFIRSLNITGASSNTGIIQGISIINPGNPVTVSNNIISLNANVRASMYGIALGDVTKPASGKIYFNTVFIGGSSYTGTGNSAALYYTVRLTDEDIKNNLFVNTRVSPNSTATHYAIYLPATGTVSLDYNDYFVSGAGSCLAYYGAKITSLPIIAGQDANSYSIDPVFATQGGVADADYKIAIDLIGVERTGIMTDYDGQPRENPTMGAWEREINKWKGGVSSAWNVAANWTANMVPFEKSNIVFDASPVNPLRLNAAHTVNNIKNSSSRNIVVNGHTLTVLGAMEFTGTGLIDAGGSSTVKFAGTEAQQLKGDDFVNGKAANIIIDNAPGVTLLSDFTIDNSLTINSGRRFVINPGATLKVPGTIANNAGTAGFIIRSTANGFDGKLINNTPSVPATVKLFLSGGNGTYGPIFHYFIPPVASMSFDNSSVATTAASLGLTSDYFKGDLMLLDETKANDGNDDEDKDELAAWQYFDGYGNTIPFNTLTSSRGYNIRFTSGDSITFTGILNASSHSFNLSFTDSNPTRTKGRNLVGNPYPSNYDLSGIDVLTNLPVNGIDEDGIGNSVYFTDDGNSFITLNCLTGDIVRWVGEKSSPDVGFSTIIAPMQGFQVVATETGKTLSLPASFKTDEPAQPSRTKGVFQEATNNNKRGLTVKKVKLALTKGSLRDETIVSLIDGATPGFDGSFDGYKFGEGSVSLYSEMGAVKYSINAIPEPAEDATATVPLRVELKTAGAYTIEIPEFENLEGITVTLKHGNTKTNLSKGTEYSFTSAAGVFTDFELIFGREDMTAGQDEVIETDFKTWYNSSSVYVNAPSGIAGGNARITVYDLQGRSLIDENSFYIEPAQTAQMPVSLQKGVYVVHIIINGRSFVSKIVVI